MQDIDYTYIIIMFYPSYINKPFNKTRPYNNNICIEIISK